MNADSHAEPSFANGLAPAFGVAYRQYTYTPDPTVAVGDAMRIEDPAPDVPIPVSTLKACAAGCTALALMYGWAKQGVPQSDRFVPSIAYIYYWARYLEATEKDRQDPGVSLSSALQACLVKGFCADALFPTESVTLRTWADSKPSARANAAAVDNGLLRYLMVRRDVTHLKNAIACKLPVLMRVVVKEHEFEEDGGYVFNPAGISHCVLGIGFEEETFLVRDTEREGGPFPIPFSRLQDPRATSDFLVVPELVPPPPPEPHAFWTQSLVERRYQALQQLDRERGSHLRYAAKFTDWVEAALAAQPLVQ
jgi:hypothetical protein